MPNYLDQNIPEVLGLQQKQKLADMLLAQGQQMPQEQMVSGRVARINPLQALLPALNTYQGMNLSKNVESEAKSLADMLRGKSNKANQEIIDAMLGKNYSPAVMPEIQKDDFGNVMPPVQEQQGQAPDMRQALSLALKSETPLGAQLVPNILGQLTKQPERVKVNQGETIGEWKNGQFNPIYTAPKEEKPPASYQEYLYAVKEGYKGSFNDYQNMDANRKRPVTKIDLGVGEQGGVNNNGVKVGSFDKLGRYISPKGEVYPAAAVTEARKEHDAATDLAFKLNQLSKDDIKNAYGSVMDYTTSKLGRMAAPVKTLDAQIKINNLQIGSVLNNLSQLKGASSDKEMAQMIKDFPGYEAPPAVMQSWVNRAAQTTNRFLKRSENRFGFDTEYADESKFVEKPNEDSFKIREKK